MPRLFVALDLPENLKAELLRLQPPKEQGVRRTTPEQLHLTLHFLGEAEIDPVVAALQSVASPAFSLSLSGIGRFANRRGPTILWTGVEMSTELTALHQAIGTALQSTGYQPEPRPFSPHITLARCAPHTPRPLIQSLLDQHAAWRWPAIPIDEFALYSSQTLPAGSVYTRVRSFTLS